MTAIIFAFVSVLIEATWGWGAAWVFAGAAISWRVFEGLIKGEL